MAKNTTQTEIDNSKVDIFMPVYIGDYLKDTTFLTTEQHGAYLLMLFACWQHGSIPDSDAVICRVTGLSSDGWAASKSIILQYFKKNNGRIHHSRIDRELESAKAKKAHFSERGKKGNAVRWSSNKESLKDTTRNPTRTKEGIPILSPSPSPSTSHIKTTTEAGGGSGLSKEFFERHDEYHFIANCEPLSKITIERYAQIKREYPNIKDFKKTLREICLKAKDPETIIKKPDGWLISNLSYASQRDESAPSAKTEWDKIIKRGCIIC